MLPSPDVPRCRRELVSFHALPFMVGYTLRLSALRYRPLSRIAYVYQSYRALVWLCLVIFVNQLGFGSVTPVVPLYAQSFGVSVAAIGFSVAIYGLARFVGGVPTGQLADRIGRQPTLVLGEVITALGNLLCGLSTDYTQFLLFRF